MKHLIAWASNLAMVTGGPGLFVVAFIDSSILSLPEINDLLIVWMVIQHKERVLYYAAMATAGSVVGCLLVYFVGLKGGEAVIRKRFSAGRVERGMATFRRYGVLAVLVPSVLPPPAPFKIFVLLAGIARVRVGTFALAIGIGRGVRYLAEGLLAVWYGELAISYIRENAKEAGLIVAGIVLLCGAVYLLWARARRRA